MTPAEVKKAVSRITYKPGWKFYAGVLPEKGYAVCLVILTAPLLDAYGSEQTIEVNQQQVYPFAFVKQWDHDMLLHVMADLIRRVEEHEMLEWFMFDGERVNDPHKKAIMALEGDQ